MSPDTFIGRHGLVLYGRTIGDRYPRSGSCEIGLCEQARLSWLASAEAGLSRFAEVSAAITEAETMKARTLARKAGAGFDRRERERELRGLRERFRKLRTERELLAVAVPAYEQAVRDGQDHEPGPLVFDHCHAHGWVRGLVCPSCNNHMTYADSGQSAEPALMDHWRKCPECRGSHAER